MFKTLQVPFCFYPDAVGGTEVYVEALAQGLKKFGVESVICAPAEKESAYSHKGLKVRRFAVPSAVSDLRELYGEGNFEAARAFSKILDEEKPDLVHLHAFTRGVSLRLVREAKSRGIPIIFTYHTPTVSCQRGTLVRWGKEICDGVLRQRLCSQCTLHGLGMNRLAAQAIGSLPSVVGRLMGRMGLAGGAWTALRMSELVRLRHQTLHRFLGEVDSIVATAYWVRDLLVRNHVSPHKIAVSRYGLCQPSALSTNCSKSEVTSSRLRLKVAFMGRMDKTKGLHILIQAVKSSLRLSVTLDLYGVAQGEFGHGYEREMHALAGEDRRITFHPSLHGEEIISTLKNFDVLAVPSQWLETGPMVVLEAFAAGIPVVGSNLGGISEFVKHETNGLLVEEFRSAKTWAESFQRLVDSPDLVARLSRGIKAPRTVEEIAQDIMSLYETQLRNKNPKIKAAHDADT